MPSGTTAFITGLILLGTRTHPQITVRKPRLQVKTLSTVQKHSCLLWNQTLLKWKTLWLFWKCFCQIIVETSSTLKNTGTIQSVITAQFKSQPLSWYWAALVPLPFTCYTGKAPSKKDNTWVLEQHVLPFRWFGLQWKVLHISTLVTTACLHSRPSTDWKHFVYNEIKNMEKTHNCWILYQTRMGQHSLPKTSVAQFC